MPGSASTSSKRSEDEQSSDTDPGEEKEECECEQQKQSEDEEEAEESSEEAALGAASTYEAPGPPSIVTGSPKRMSQVLPALASETFSEEEGDDDFWLIDFNKLDADDPSGDGCLWMHVLQCLGNGRYGRHAVQGMRYPNFADMWSFILREPAALVPFEGVCRMEAAADLRQALPAQKWYSKVSHWTDGANERDSSEALDPAQLHAMAPGSASKCRELNQPKMLAQRWLRHRVNEEVRLLVRQRAWAQGRTLNKRSPKEIREGMAPVTWTGPTTTPERVDAAVNVKLPLGNGKEDESVTGGEDGDGEEDEEEEKDSAEEREEGDTEGGEKTDELDAETDVDSWAACVTPTGNEGHVESPCGTPEKVKRRRIERPQQSADYSDEDCGSCDESPDNCF